MKQWMVLNKGADFDAIGLKFGISKFLARIIRNRNVIGDKNINLYLNGKKEDMHDPYLLKDMKKACIYMMESISKGEKILIVGDYDIDGVMSTSILYKGLKEAGAIVSFRLPERLTDGYGINKTMIDEAINDKVSLIITCDNGIAAYNEIEYANSAGIKVIITDHHEIPYDISGDEKKYIIPKAVAIVNPHQEDCSYPFKEICGGMVAYKFISCLKQEIEKNSDFSLHNISDKLMDELFEFAAFATVGDVMPLIDENRIAVKYGLESMKKTYNTGLRALINATGTKADNLSVYHIGFVLGPCVNAAGRLESAKHAISLFLTDDYDEAENIAINLKEINDERKKIQEEQILKAYNIIEKSSEHNYMKDNVLVIYLEDCHESVAGLVAGRIREKYYKPVYVITKGIEGVKGSGRSIDGYNMYEEMNKCKDLFTKFGGHAMAAGFSLLEENIDRLRDQLNENEKLTEEDLTEKLEIDIPLPINYISYNLVNELSLAGPYGQKNPSPLFAQKDLKIVSRFASKNRNTVFLNLKSEGIQGMKDVVLKARYFTDADVFLEKIKGCDKITIAYVPEINDYNGNVSLQLNIKDVLL